MCGDICNFVFIAGRSSLKRKEGISQLISDFIEAGKNFTFNFLHK
jgi:hypothetical protein